MAGPGWPWAPSSGLTTIAAKRRDVIRVIARAAQEAGLTWQPLREGRNHTVYILDGLRIVVLRHREIPTGTTTAIYRECEPKLGKGLRK